MLNVTRRKTLLVVLVILASSTIVAFAAYQIRDAVLFARLPDTEKKVIGVWTWTTIDAVGRMRMRPNHRFEMWFIESKRDEEHPDSRNIIHGRWTVEGTEFKYICDPGQLGQVQPEQQRIPISDFGDGMKRVH